MVREFAECDHGDKDQPHDEHREDDTAALGGGVCHEPECGEHAAMLPHPTVVRDSSSVNRRFPGGRTRQGFERRWVSQIGKLQPSGVEPSFAE